MIFLLCFFLKKTRHIICFLIPDSLNRVTQKKSTSQTRRNKSESGGFQIPTRRRSHRSDIFYHIDEGPWRQILTQGTKIKRVVVPFFIKVVRYYISVNIRVNIYTIFIDSISLIEIYFRNFFKRNLTSKRMSYTYSFLISNVVNRKSKISVTETLVYDTSCISK